MEKKKSRIEEAARELFISQGFHATSMRTIAARAGTSLGNVYNYYRTAATNPGMMRYGYLISPFACGLAALLLWLASRSMTDNSDTRKT